MKIDELAEVPLEAILKISCDSLGVGSLGKSEQSMSGFGVASQTYWKAGVKRRKR